MPKKEQEMTSKKEKMSPFAQELLQSMAETIGYLIGAGPARETRLTLPEMTTKKRFMADKDE